MEQKTRSKNSTKHAASRAFQGGSYSLLITAVVVAIVLAVNVLVSALPPSMTRIDISASKLYSVTSNTKTVLRGLAQDVTIHWIVQSGKEDAVLENLLNKYQSLSDHVKVVKKNPDVFPTFVQQYTDEQAANNSLVVECGDRSRFIGYEDIYLVEAVRDAYSYNTSFDGEGAITSAIDYVTNEEQPLICLLEGHGEQQLPAVIADQIEKANMETAPLSLLNVDQIPQDADALMIYGPQSDLSQEERTMLQQYTQSGGKLFVAAGPTENGALPNLYSLLEPYHITVAEGIVVEGDRSHYAFRLPYALMPELQSHPMTDPLIAEHYYPIVPIAQGLVLGNLSQESGVTPLLMTTAQAYSKTDAFELETYEWEEGDAPGPFALGVAIDCPQGGQIIWFSSSDFMQENYNAFSSGSNGDLVMNSLSSMVGESEAMAIRSKPLNYNYLTISEETSSLFKVLMIGVFPLTYLGVGVAVVVGRRRKNYDAI